MPTPTEPSDPRLRRIVAALHAVPPARLTDEPWAAPSPAVGRRPQAPRRRLALVLLLGAALLSGGVVASLASTSSSPNLSAATKAEFAVFNGRGIRPPAAVTGELARILRSLTEVAAAVGDGRIDPASVRVSQASAAFAIVVAGNSDLVCLMGREPGLATGRLIAAGGGCGPATVDVNAARLICGTIEAPPRGTGMFLLDCLVPNGVSAVKVDTPDGPVATKVIDNTIAVIAHRPDGVSWITPNGTARHEQIIQ